MARPPAALGAASLLVLLLLGALAACGHSAHGSDAQRLDAIVVLGHSGTTGYDSDPTHPQTDVRANSWATGTNPAVNSIYQRLLATHPALKGHATSLGMDGSTVDALATQIQEMLALRPLPDVVLIQTIDNDIRCDGSDAQNLAPFGHTLDQALSTIERKDPGAQVFLVAQWSSVRDYTRYAAARPEIKRANAGTGPCDTFTLSGRVRPVGISSLQHIVDAYYAQVSQVCARHPRCFTDHGAMKTMRLAAGDTRPDGNHLSVQGLHKMAALAWTALPDAIKNRP